MKKIFIASISILIVFFGSSVVALVPNQTDTRAGLSDELIYFVLVDRYQNGDKLNDRAGGGLVDPTNGFNPTSTAFFHGGDLAGLAGDCQPGDTGLARIKELGFTTVWLTPIVEQVPATPSGAGYHGYWGAKFDEIDPHLGSKVDLKKLTDCAKKLGLKIVLDVVTNHTGDVNQYNNRIPYIPAGLENSRSPEWLNKIENYHNIGSIDNCWSSENCSRVGDFFGLDDLATSRPEVYNGWAEVYGNWIKEYGFAGFRVDTAKHLDDKFFARWTPQILSTASAAGIPNFQVFGEVWDTNPIELMHYIRRENLDSVLDFPFQKAAVEFASGNNTGPVLKRLFAADDFYSNSRTTANNLVTFLGNHDMGRIGFFISTSRFQSDAEALKRVQLAHELLYFSRGIPVVYYGDEVGMTGTGRGNDQLARQSMFSTQINSWKTETRIGSRPIGNGDAFAVTKTHPIANHLTNLAKLRSANLGLGNHQMQVRQANAVTTVVSKRNDQENVEYLVAFNNSSKVQSVKVSTSTKSANWQVLYGASRVKAKANQVSFRIPSLSTVVIKADRKINLNDAKLINLSVTNDSATGYKLVQAKISTNDLPQVQFWIRSSPDLPWQFLGQDDNSPYRHYLDPIEVNGFSEYELKVNIKLSSGKILESQAIKVKN